MELPHLSLMLSICSPLARKLRVDAQNPIIKCPLRCWLWDLGTYKFELMVEPSFLRLSLCNPSTQCRFNIVRLSSEFASNARRKSSNSITDLREFMIFLPIILRRITSWEVREWHYAIYRKHISLALLLPWPGSSFLPTPPPSTF